MKKKRLINSFFLIPGRDIVKNFLAFFRITEADARTLLAAHGFHALEVDPLENNRSTELKKSSKDSPVPADLDTALSEIAERIDFDWPEALGAERVHAGIAEIVLAAFVSAGFVVLALRTILS